MGFFFKAIHMHYKLFPVIFAPLTQLLIAYDGALVHVSQVLCLRI